MQIVCKCANVVANLSIVGVSYQSEFLYTQNSLLTFFFPFSFVFLSLSLPLRLIGDHEEQLEQRKSDEGTHQKYEVLFQRDQEMTQFIENYDETEKKGLQEQKDTQQVIVQLLEAMSKDLGRQNNM